MRTTKEIVTRIHELKKEDFFGFQRGDLIAYLPFKLAKEFIDDDKIKEAEKKWKPESKKHNDILTGMKKYMDFAIDKATDHRGLSAGKSIEHYKAWVWMLGDEDYASIDWENYPQYGMPILKQICDKYGFNFTDVPSYLNMADGSACCDGCEHGCGS